MFFCQKVKKCSENVCVCVCGVVVGGVSRGHRSQLHNMKALAGPTPGLQARQHDNE